MTVRKVIIPAAGLGTRLYPLTKSQPKEMLPVGNKPAIQLVVEEALAAGITEVFMVTGQHKRAIEDHFDVGNGHGPAHSWDSMLPQALLDEVAHVFYVRQSEPKGLGDAVLRAAPLINGEPFLVSLGDAIIHAKRPGPSIVERMIELLQRERPEGIVAVREVSESQLSSYGVVAPVNGTAQAAFQITDLVEKPAAAEAPSRYAITGRYLFTPRIFDYLRRTERDRRGEIQLTDAIRAMVGEGHSVWAVKLEERREVRYDIGDFLQYAEAFISEALQDPRVAAPLRAYLQVELQGGEAGTPAPAVEPHRGGVV